MITHVCGSRELRTNRLLLALLSNDLDAYELIIDELQRCQLCWENVAHYALALLGSSRVLQAGGVEPAADAVLAELACVLTPKRRWE